MADQLQFRGGNTAESDTFTGASKEITVDTDKKTVVVHDGSTVGGFPVAREDLNNVTITSENVDYDNTESGLDADNVQGAIDKVTGDLGTMANQDADGVAITGGSASVSTAAVTDTTDATSTADAPLKTAGGLAVAKDAYFGEATHQRGSPLVGRRGAEGEIGEFVLSDSTEGHINFGQQLRLRLGGTLDSVGSLRVRLQAQEEGFNTVYLVEKDMTFLTFNDRIQQLTTNNIIEKGISFTDVNVTHTGANHEIDLIIKNPSSSRDIQRWLLSLEAVAGRGGRSFSLISTQIETIST